MSFPTLCVCLHLGAHTQLSRLVALEDCPGLCELLLRLPNVCRSSTGTIVCVWHVAEPKLGFACGCSTQRMVTQSKQASYPLAQRGLLPQMTAFKKTTMFVCMFVCWQWWSLDLAFLNPSFTTVHSEPQKLSSDGVFELHPAKLRYNTIAQCC